MNTTPEGADGVSSPPSNTVQAIMNHYRATHPLEPICVEDLNLIPPVTELFENYPDLIIVPSFPEEPDIET